MKNQNITLRRQQQGVAAVEFALLLPVIVVLLAFLLFFGRFCWHYTVAVKAASDMATFLALARDAEMTEARSDLGEIGIVQLARSIGAAELADLNPGNGGRPVIDITCDAIACRGEVIPTEIVVSVRMRMYDPFLPQLLSFLGDTEGMWIHAETRVLYAGS